MGDKTFIVIGRGVGRPIAVKVFNRRSIIEMLCAHALVFHEWEHIGFLILDNF